MLKPTKKITKKEIQHDPFLDTMDKAQSYFEENKSLMMQVLAGLIILTLAFNYFSDQSDVKETKASAALGQALVALDRGDTDNAVFQLETVMAEYGGTPASEQAGYHIGKQKYESGDLETAKSYLTTFMNNKPMDLMMSSTATMLADIAMQDGDTQGANSYFDRAIRSTTDKHIRRIVSIKKGEFNYRIGKLDEAKSIADDVLNEKNITPVERQAAEELLGKIPG